MKIRIEMEVPDEMDTSTVLERMQELAAEWYEEHSDDEDPDEVERLQDEVSVEVLS